MLRLRFAAIPIAVAALLALVTVTAAAFSAGTSNPANAFSAAPDWTAPIAAASKITRTSGTTPSTLVAGTDYYVYADVSPDSGNPASGTQSVTANVSNLTA